MSLPVHLYLFSAPSIHIHPSSVALILHRVIGILEPMPGDSGYKVSWTRCQQCMLIEDDWGGNPRNTARTRKKKNSGVLEVRGKHARHYATVP